MGCTYGLLPVLNGCSVRPVKGIKNIWCGLRSDFVITYVANKITNVAKSGAGVLRPLLGTKDFCNVKYDAVVGTGIKTGYKHTVEILGTPINTAFIFPIDTADDLIFISQTNQGEYLISGAHYGLFKDKQELDINNNNGQMSFSFSSAEGIEEPYSEYVLLPTTGTPDAKIISLL